MRQERTIDGGIGREEAVLGRKSSAIEVVPTLLCPAWVDRLIISDKLI